MSFVLNSCEYSDHPLTALHPAVANTIKTFTSPGACIIKPIMAVIYDFRNKLNCMSLNTRLGWKRLPGTNTLAYYGNRKLRL